MLERYVSGETGQDRYSGTWVVIDTADEGVADRSAAAYAKARGWASPRVRRRHPRPASIRPVRVPIASSREDRCNG